MKEKIKTIYFILGVILLILVGLAVIIWISKQVNWEFFTFDKERCIANYLVEKEYFYYNLSDEKLKEVSQLWNLELNYLLTLRETDKQKAEKEKQECEEKYRKCEESRKPGEGCVRCLPGLPFLSLRGLLEEQIQNGKYPKLPESIMNELTSKGVCPHPSLLK